MGPARQRRRPVRHRRQHRRRCAGQRVCGRRRQPAHPGVRQQRHVQDRDQERRKRAGDLHDAWRQPDDVRVEFESAERSRYRGRDLQDAPRWNDRRQVRPGGQAAEGVRHGHRHRLPHRERPLRRRGRQLQGAEADPALVIKTHATSAASLWVGWVWWVRWVWPTCPTHPAHPRGRKSFASQREAMKRVCIVAALLLDVAAAAGPSDKWWPDFGANAASSHFVESEQITRSNVAQLEVAWFYPYGQTGFNPIVVDGVMYVLGRNNSLIALDAASGKEIWIHERLNGITSRGINYWASPEGKDRRLVFAINGYMQAIDARSGESIRSFGDNGLVDLRNGLARAEGTDRRVQSRSPGKIWKNLLIMGSASGEGWITPPGDIRAYDVVSGKLAWQFHTVPLPGEFGYDTWPRDAHKYVGGANNWGEMSVDEERGIVYIPTGSATYDFYGADRIGMNLFANCLLALDARTGKRLWHYQTVHHDLWDMDNVSAPQLVTVQHNGRKVDAVAHAGKTGFLYVFDRVTGKPLWPIEERAVPKSDVPGEQSWPTQPFPTKPPAFARQSFTVDDINPRLLTPEDQAKMRDRVSKARNEGIYTPPALRDTISMPGNQGGSNWGTTGSNPKTGTVFVVNVNELAILKLEDVKTRAGRTVGAAAGQQAYQQFCQPCHGAIQQGGIGGRAPALVDIANRLGEDAVRATVTGGKGDMRPVTGITDAELNAVVSFLSNPPQGGGRGAPNLGPLPPGPVVASGGVRPPPRPLFTPVPAYGRVGGHG